MGLAQRKIESAGMATMALSPMASWTRAVGAPRTAAIEHPLGLPLGKPGDSPGQKDVLRAALQAFEKIGEPGGLVDPPFEWPDPPRKSRYHPRKAPPITRMIRRRPWLLARMISGSIPK